MIGGGVDEVALVPPGYCYWLLGRFPHGRFIRLNDDDGNDEEIVIVCWACPIMKHHS